MEANSPRKVTVLPLQGRTDADREAMIVAMRKRIAPLLEARRRQPEMSMTLH